MSDKAGREQEIISFFNSKFLHGSNYSNLNKKRFLELFKWKNLCGRSVLVVRALSSDLMQCTEKVKAQKSGLAGEGLFFFFFFKSSEIVTCNGCMQLFKSCSYTNKNYIKQIKYQTNKYSIPTLNEQWWIGFIWPEDRKSIS